jgi:hypothetical protein
MKNAFSCFVFGSYQKFIPYYIFGINQNYENIDIIIFYEKTLNTDIKKYILEKKNVILHENFDFNGKSDWLENLKIRGGGKKTLLRFLIEGSFFENYKYVYFGDVDILILKEKESLFNLHKKQILKNKIPFSNKVRKNGKSLSNRLTGLHFVEVKPYFKLMDNVIHRFLEDKKYRSILLKDVKRDEELLYNLNQAAFKFDSIEVSKNKRPWHGFHLGLVRGKNFLNLENVKANSSLTVKELKQELLNLNKEGELNRLLYRFYCGEVYFTYKYLGLNLPFLLVQYYKINEFKVKLISFFKRLKKYVRKQFATP